MQKPIEIIVDRPTLSVIVHRTATDLGTYRAAVEELISLVFGHRHTVLTPEQRRDRLTIYKLGNLIGRMELLTDVPVFDIGFRCPEQLRSYHAALMRNCRLAYHAGASGATLRVLDDLHETLWIIHNEVTAFYGGLS
jgi:hypothetical protein